jgi:hypothetical protein
MKNTYIEKLVKKIENKEEISGGERALALAYKSSITRKGFEVLVFDEILWEYDVETFVKALRASGISELYMTTQASNMLETYLRLEELDLKLRGVVRLEDAEYKRDMEQFGSSFRAPTIPAMKFSFEEAAK